MPETAGVAGTCADEDDDDDEAAAGACDDDAAAGACEGVAGVVSMGAGFAGAAAAARGLPGITTMNELSLNPMLAIESSSLRILPVVRIRVSKQSCSHSTTLPLQHRKSADTHPSR